MPSVSIWIVTVLSIAGVITRPFKTPEFIWAVGGAVLLLVLGLITPTESLSGITKGMDVYLFLTGMMLLAETAREEKLFDWLPTLPNGPTDRLANVLTLAVAAAVKTAKVKKPLPHLFICAFIANAASFVLPISNPANLVCYGLMLTVIKK